MYFLKKYILLHTDQTKYFRYRNVNHSKRKSYIFCINLCILKRNLINERDCLILICAICFRTKVETETTGANYNCIIISDYSCSGLPVAFLAPESLIQKTFTMSSDVWTTACFTYELFTYGSPPYADHLYTSQSLENGVSLVKKSTT